MATITAKVVRVTDKEKNYYVALENKMMLSGWLNKKPDTLVNGVTAMFAYTQNGQFNNIDSVMVVPEGAENAPEYPVEEVCMESVRELQKAVQEWVEELENNPKKYDERFSHWVEGDNKPSAWETINFIKHFFSLEEMKQ